MNDLGVITSNIRVRRKVHDPKKFPALRNQSRVSGAYTHQPPPEKEKVATTVVAPEPPAPPMSLPQRYKLRSNQRPANLLAYLHSLADSGMALPSAALLEQVMEYVPSDVTSFSIVINKTIQALVDAGAVTAWTGAHHGNAPRLRAFRLADGRVVASVGAPEGVV